MARTLIERSEESRLSEPAEQGVDAQSTHGDKEGMVLELRACFPGCNHGLGRRYIAFEAYSSSSQHL